MINEFGILKWENTMQLLERPDTIENTYQNFIPNFLDKLLS